MCGHLLWCSGRDHNVRAAVDRISLGIETKAKEMTADADALIAKLKEAGVCVCVPLHGHIF